MGSAVGTSEGRDAAANRRRVRRLGVALVAVVLAIAGFIAGRSALANSVRDEVQISGGTLECEGTSVSLSHDGADLWTDGVPVAAIDPGMDCQYSFAIRNASARSATIERVTFPVLGPLGGAAVEAVALMPLGLAPEETAKTDFGPEAPIDAIFDTDVTVDARSELVLSLQVVARPSGCTGPGTTIGFPNSPKIRVRTWGVSGSIEPEGTGFGFVGHETFGNCNE